jgi:hypothetical protein
MLEGLNGWLPVECLIANVIVSLRGVRQEIEAW